MPLGLPVPRDLYISPACANPRLRTHAVNRLARQRRYEQVARRTFRNRTEPVAGPCVGPRAVRRTEESGEKTRRVERRPEERRETEAGGEREKWRESSAVQGGAEDCRWRLLQQTDRIGGGWPSTADGKTVILLTPPPPPPLHVMGVSIWKNRGCQQSDSLAYGWAGRCRQNRSGGRPGACQPASERRQTCDQPRRCGSLLLFEMLTPPLLSY